MLVNRNAGAFMTRNLSLDVAGMTLSASVVKTTEILFAKLCCGIGSSRLQLRSGVVLDRPSTTITVDIGVTVQLAVLHVLLREVVALWNERGPRSYRCLHTINLFVHI